MTENGYTVYVTMRAVGLSILGLPLPLIELLTSKF